MFYERRVERGCSDERHSWPVVFSPSSSFEEEREQLCFVVRLFLSFPKEAQGKFSSVRRREAQCEPPGLRRRRSSAKVHNSPRRLL
jgi:hypothetical protein